MGYHGLNTRVHISEKQNILYLESLLFRGELPFQLLHSLHLIVKLEVGKRIRVVKVIFFLILILKEILILLILIEPLHLNLLQSPDDIIDAQIL